MRKLLLLAAILVLFSTAINNTKLPEAENESNISQVDGNALNQLVTSVVNLVQSIDYVAIVNTLNQAIQQIEQSLDYFQKDQAEPDPIELFETPTLETPEEQVFSVFNIELGDTRAEVEQLAGHHQRESFNEYDVNWFTYHDQYRNFFMVSYDQNDQVVGLFTNQELLSSKNGIEIGSPKSIVQEQLGTPLDFIQKGFTRYQLPDDRDYDVYKQNGSYLTIFYDKHENDTVTAIQILSEDLEDSKQDIYSEASADLKEGFEYQLFDLTNAARIVHGLSPLTWDEHVRVTARDHSNDMAKNDYFNHTNLEGQSPFDRMKEDQVQFHSAGENLAYGQFSSIFAHEGLMNSLGHRENILQPDYEFLGVGVAFNDESQPYFTQNFYSK